MVTVTTRSKPSKIDVAEELGFSQKRMPETGPGSHKPNKGRGGLPLTDKYYLGEDEIKIPEKKGLGIGEKVKEETTKEKKDSKTTSWSDVV